MSEISKNLHRDIMRSVKIVKRRYYLYGLLTGFFASLIALSWVVYTKMLEEGSLDFIGVLSSVLRVDATLVVDFKEDLVEFLPLDHLGWILALLVVTSVLVGIVFKYRKVLFIKVAEFRK